MAVNKPKTEIMTEIKAGIIKSAGTAVPEIKSTFLDVRINGWNLAIGSAIPASDRRAAIPPVKRMLVNVCRNMTQPVIRMLK